MIYKRMCNNLRFMYYSYIKEMYSMLALQIMHINLSSV